MINFYETIDGVITALPEMKAGCWVNVVHPDEDEIKYLTEDCGLDVGFVRSALDEEETSRIEVEEEQVLIIVDTPLTQLDQGGMVYVTTPIGVILSGSNLFTISQRENSVLSEFSEGQVRGADTTDKYRFLMSILLKFIGRFHQYLRQIDKITSYIEKQLHKSLRNKELIQLMELQKSLVYFSTSLKADELTFEKILRGRIIKLGEEEQELLEDVIVEVKQAIEMSNIYSQVLTGTMDAFASVISNNLNIVMKVLTSITILLAIPNVITSAYGMNVSNLPFPNFWFPIGITAVVLLIATYFLKKYDMFK